MTKRIVLLQGLAATPDMIVARMGTRSLNQPEIQPLFREMASCEAATLRLLADVRSAHDAALTPVEKRANSYSDEIALFLQLRHQTLALLKLMDPMDWQCTAVHAILGTGSIELIVQKQLEHDRLHLSRLAESLITDQAAPATRSQTKGTS